VYSIEREWRCNIFWYYHDISAKRAEHEKIICIKFIVNSFTQKIASGLRAFHLINISQNASERIQRMKFNCTAWKKPYLSLLCIHSCKLCKFNTFAQWKRIKNNVQNEIKINSLEFYNPIRVNDVKIRDWKKPEKIANFIKSLHLVDFYLCAVEFEWTKN
jgi:hypothetical protein